MFAQHKVVIAYCTQETERTKSDQLQFWSQPNYFGKHFTTVTANWD